MSDDLSIPSPTYRAPQRHVRLEPGPRRLMIYAGGLVAAGVVIAGVSMMFSRQGNGPVPVIQADPRPLRIKPENPGGMQVAGAKADRTSEGDQPGKLAPAPETPDPSLMSTTPPAAPAAPAETASAGAARDAAVAKLPAASKPQVEVAGSSAHPATNSAASAAPPVRMAAPPAPTPVPTAAAAASRAVTALAPPAGVRPVPAPTPVTQSPPAGTLVAPPAKAAAPPAKAVSVQLAALLTEEAARAEWQQMERRMPEVLSSRTPGFSKFERDGRTYWRVRVSGFGDVQQAKSFCDRVRAKNASCSVADF